jgi:serine protease Do
MKNKTHKIGVVSASLAALIFAAAPGPARAQQAPVAPPPDAPAQGFFVQGDFGYLGVGVEEVTPDKAKELKMPTAYGVAVIGVGENSPAAKAGLKKGDVIVQYNDQRVEGTAVFRRLVRETPPGRTAQLSVWRDGRAEKLSVEVGHAPEQAAGNDFFGRGRENGPRDFSQGNSGPRDFGQAPQTPLLPGREYGNRGFANTPMLGVSAMDLSSQLGQYFGAPNGEGVLVTEVHKGTAGEKAGLKAGDVITKVNGEAVRNVGELRQHLRDARDTKNVSLIIVRKGAEMTVTAELQTPQAPAATPESERRIPL